MHRFSFMLSNSTTVFLLSKAYYIICRSSRPSLISSHLNQQHKADRSRHCNKWQTKPKYRAICKLRSVPKRFLSGYAYKEQYQKFYGQIIVDQMTERCRINRFGALCQQRQKELNMVHMMHLATRITLCSC